MKMIFKVCALVLSVFVMSVAFTGVASACDRGWTCFWDWETGDRGQVAGNNRNWAALPGGWDNRADRFHNNGRTHQNALYSGKHYTGASKTVFRGTRLTWRNVVSSNLWWKLTVPINF